MMKTSLLWVWLGLFWIPFSYAELQDGEFLNKLNEDPSLLLDTTQYVEPPAPTPEPASAPEPVSAPEPEREPASPAETVPAMPEPEVPVVEAVAPAPAPILVAEKVEVEKKVQVTQKTCEETSKKSDVKSELVALPGVSDFPIILSGDQFLPSLIRIKKNENKNRLLFVSTSQKPAALIFVKPKIQRWISSKPETTSREDYREINNSKVTEIEFDADIGIYEYYDALSGARGEIKVE